MTKQTDNIFCILDSFAIRLESEEFAIVTKGGSVTTFPKGTQLLVLDKTMFKIAKALELQYNVIEKGVFKTEQICEFCQYYYSPVEYPWGCCAKDKSKKHHLGLPYPDETCSDYQKKKVSVK